MKVYIVLRRPYRDREYIRIEGVFRDRKDAAAFQVNNFGSWMVEETLL